MSTTLFDDVFRTALWNAYNYRCFYCQQPLEWSSYQIDHLLPEWLNDNPEKLGETIKDYGLDKEFHINVPYNFVPAHIQCNNRKSGQIFEKETRLYYIQLSKAKQDVLNKEIKSFENKKRKGVIFSRVQAALATGLIDTEEMAKIIQTARENEWLSSSIEISGEINCIDGIIKTFYRNEDYSWLQNKPIPSNQITLINDKGEERSLLTLKEFNQALNDGFYPNTNVDLKGASGFTFLESLLKALEGATMPKISFIDEPRLTLQDFNYLSPSILLDTQDLLKEYIEKGHSVQDLIDQGIVKVDAADPYEISLEFDQFMVSFREQFRADFNGDGIEDIFVQAWTNAVGGTLGFGSTMILTRYSNKHLIEPAK